MDRHLCTIKFVNQLVKFDNMEKLLRINATENFSMNFICFLHLSVESNFTTWFTHF